MRIASAFIMGWGIFNLVEGLIDHHILNLHHVIERLGVSGADYAFLLSGVLFISIGWMLDRAGSKDTPASHPSPATH